MGKKALAVVPVLGKESKLERFHGDAAEKPLYTVVTWSAQMSASQAVRKRQLAITGNALLEMQRFQAPAEDERSWFVGNDVQQDGSMLVFTPIDPLFVLLASTWRHRERSMSLYDLLSQDHNSWLTQVIACTQEKIQLVCDVQPTRGDDSLDSLLVKASETKTLKWLSAKVNRVAKTLAQHARDAKAQSNSGNFDANFVLPGHSAEPKPVVDAAASVALDPLAFTRESIDLLADYLPDELTELLLKEFKLEKLAPVTKQAAPIASPHEAFQRFDRRLQVDSSNLTSSKRTPSPAAAAANAKKKSKLANVDRTGMKSLTSFFTKK